MKFISGADNVCIRSVGLHMKKSLCLSLRFALAGSGSLGFVASLRLVGREIGRQVPQDPVSATGNRSPDVV